MNLSDKLIVSLFDKTGEWCRPYAEAGANVMPVDIDVEEVDIADIDCEWFIEEIMELGCVDGIIAGPPCTDFTSSGAWTWKAKDADGRTERSAHLVRQVLRAVEFCQPDFWWLENPVGRIAKVVPELEVMGGKPLWVDPCDFGHPWTKKTGLWGNFNRDLPYNRVTPVKVCKQGSWLQQLGGKSKRTKDLRSATPPNMAQALFEANCWRPGQLTQATLETIREREAMTNE